jgi:hypothetical protein
MRFGATIPPSPVAPLTAEEEAELRTLGVDYDYSETAIRALLARVKHLQASVLTPGDHCPWSTKHGLWIYEYCSRPRGHDGHHCMNVVRPMIDALAEIYDIATEHLEAETGSVDTTLDDWERIVMRCAQVNR